MALNFTPQGNNGNNLDQMYAELARLRAMQTPQPTYRTVFNDIADEWANCSEDERDFVNKDAEYLEANVSYQQQFNSFLLELVGAQFINSQYGKSAEQVLAALKKAKSKYKKENAENIVSVKAENAELQRQLKELKEALGVK